MPWMKGRRPDWLIRLGLFLYDTLGGRKILPGTKTLDLKTDAAGKALQGKFVKGFEYSDCWIEDARLVLLNARDAEARGAAIMARTKVTGARFEDGAWTVETEKAGLRETHRARMLVNAGGPWVEDVIHQTLRINSREGVRLVRGSHIVTKRLFDHDKCYFFQGGDGRIIFAMPYETDFTLIGTTDADHPDASEKPECTEEEAEYLCAFASNYFEKPVTRDDIVWTYSGVRPLYDDGASSATAATREYVLSVDTSTGGPVLNVFGGKITTFRKLAEAALEKIDATLGRQTKGWTAGAALPGGDIPFAEVGKRIADLGHALPFFDQKTRLRLFRQYGSACEAIFSGVSKIEECGQSFGHGVTAREVDWAIAHEWVHEAEDFLWRRSKLGLRFSPEETAALSDYIAEKTGEGVAKAS